MSWLLIGMVFGQLAPLFARIAILFSTSSKADGKVVVTLVKFIIIVVWLILFGIFFAPAAGGFVVVIQMLQEYGGCVEV
jgi:hypothetical protein